MPLTKVNGQMLDGAINALSNGNVGIGTTTPANNLQVYRNASAAVIAVQNQTNDLQLQVNDGVASGAGVIYLSGAYPLTLWTNGSERMRIDSSGRVTTPFQPVFLASFSSPVNVSVATGVKIAFNSVKFDRGSNFSTANNRYTAPVTGAYKMTVSFHISNTTQNRPVFRVNGNDYVVTSDAAQSIIQVGSIGDLCLILDIVMQLNAGDYVEIFNRTGGTSNMQFYAGHSWWSGYLIG